VTLGLLGAKREVGKAPGEAQRRPDAERACVYGPKLDAFAGHDLLIDATLDAQVEEGQRFIVLGEPFSQCRRDGETGVDVSCRAAAG
jgi:hypothetical protein